MATRVIDDSKLNDIAVAIQAKDSGGQMTVDEMPTRIANIPTGGGTLISKTIIKNGIYNASSDNADGYDVVTVDVPQDPNENFDKFMNDTLERYSTTATTIPSRCFENKTNMLSITMPNVTTIGSWAFKSCTRLTMDSLPSGLTGGIGAETFYGCNELSLTNIPNGITRIGSDAFNRCYKLALTVLPQNLQSISDAAFSRCEKIVITSFPNSLTNIGAGAFNLCTGIPYIDVSNMTNRPTIASSSFSNTTFPFYFRDQQQLDEWASATNWSTYADRFQIKPNEVI